MFCSNWFLETDPNKRRNRWVVAEGLFYGSPDYGPPSNISQVAIGGWSRREKRPGRRRWGTAREAVLLSSRCRRPGIVMPRVRCRDQPAPRPPAGANADRAPSAASDSIAGSPRPLLRFAAVRGRDHPMVDRGRSGDRRVPRGRPDRRDSWDRSCTPSIPQRRKKPPRPGNRGGRAVPPRGDYSRKDA